ncbi:hypothetical protein MMC34_001340 [Xylographa carneopallida]|nr:hypothetical protein [Xylographa carneopallida]
MKKATVAVVGGGAGSVNLYDLCGVLSNITAGPFGLSAVKNLRDVGFDVTLFEQRDTIGGVWAFSEDPGILTTLPTTVSNVSKYRVSAELEIISTVTTDVSGADWSQSCFTDFPAPDDAPVYLPGPQVHEYIKDYAKHFKLLPHVKLNTKVVKVVRNKDDTKWQVHIRTGNVDASLEFDKVIFCNGLMQIPSVPKFEGREKFTGTVIHSQAFKRPEDFAGQNVVVVGLGNSAADTATGLVGHAANVYLSHRRGMNIFPRTHHGLPLDLKFPRRLLAIKNILARFVPTVSQWLFDREVRALTTSVYTLDPSWRIHPPPTIVSHQPTITDTLIPCLHAGSITSVHGIHRFRSAKAIELLDGSILTDIDAVVLCAGYQPRLDLMPDHNPTASPQTRAFVQKTGYNGPPLARLYQNIFPPAHASSVAYLNYNSLTEGAVPVGDLCAMAVAGVWSRAHRLPAPAAMDAHIDAHHAWVAALATNDTVYAAIVNEGPWLSFLNDAAGTRVNEHLGYGWRGWAFWISDWRFCNLCMGGVLSAHVYRLWGRGRWEGARGAVEKANREVVKREGEEAQREEEVLLLVGEGGEM